MYQVPRLVCAGLHQLEAPLLCCFGPTYFRLLSLFRKEAARTGKVAKVFTQLFRMHDLQEQVAIHIRRTAVVPAYPHEDDSSFLKIWNENGAIQ